MFFRDILIKNYSLADFERDFDRHFYGGLESASGLRINEESAMKFSAVYACVRIISEDLGMLATELRKWRDPKDHTKGSDPAFEHPLYDVLMHQPNNDMTSMIFYETMQQHILLSGNGYAYKNIDSRGRVVGLKLLDWSKITPVRNKETGEIQYIFKDNATEITFKQWEIFHIPGLGYDGILGYSPIHMSMDAIGLGLAAEQFANYFYRNGANVGGIITMPGAVKDKEGLRKEIQEKYGGLGKAHKIMVLEDGMNFQKMVMPLAEAQFIDCVVPDTLISMANGTQKVAEDLVEGDFVIGWENDTPIKAKVKHIGKPPLKKLVKIKTSKGRELTATYDHPCLTIQELRTAGGRKAKINPEWIAMGDLKIGNYVRIGLGNVGNDNNFGFDNAYLIGALVGNGYLRSGGCTFTSPHIGVVNNVNKILMYLGGALKNKKTYDYDIITNGIGCKGSKVRDFLKETGLIGTHSDTKFVPDIILKGGVNAWAGFLSGYFDTDGTIDTVNKSISWCSINLNLLKQCQHLLSLLGINSGIYKYYDACKKNILGNDCDAQTCYGLYVCNINDIKKLAKYLISYNDEKSEIIKSYEFMPDSRYREENFIYDRVESVEFLGEGETVGIEIEGCHTHITNGIVTHNTRKFQKVEIASIYRMPLKMIQDHDRSTFSNNEQQELDYVKHTIMPWVKRWEQSIDTRLLTKLERNQGYYTRFNFDELLRGDAKTRAEVNHIRRQDGVISGNEWRAMDDMNPRQEPEADKLVINGNMRTIDIVNESVGQSLEQRGEDNNG